LCIQAVSLVRILLVSQLYISSSEICKHDIETCLPQNWRSFVTKRLVVAQKLSASCSHYRLELPVDIVTVVNEQCK